MSTNEVNKVKQKPRDLSGISILSYVEYNGKQVNIEAVGQAIKSLYSKKYHKKLNTLEIYINVAEERAYYVANGVAGPNMYIDLNTINTDTQNN